MNKQKIIITVHFESTSYIFPIVPFIVSVNAPYCDGRESMTLIYYNLKEKSLAKP